SFAIAERVSRRLKEQHGNGSAPRGYAYFSPASRDVNAIRITAVSPDPKEAALLANLYAEEYVKLTQEANRSYMSASRAFLEEQERQRQQELRVVEEQYANYLERGGISALDQR